MMLVVVVVRMLRVVLMRVMMAREELVATRGILILPFFQKSLFCMLPSFATCLKVFKTVFVFALQPFLPMWVLFFGFNGNINGKMTKINNMAKNHFSGVQNDSQSV